MKSRLSFNIAWKASNFARTALIIAGTVLVCGASSSAEAGLQPGYYEGRAQNAERKTTGHTQIWVRKVRSLSDENQGAQAEAGQSATMALVYYKESETASLFLIDELDETRQRWVQLFQNDKFILATDYSGEATYEGTAFTQGGRNGLRLISQTFGRGIGCNDEIEAYRATPTAKWDQFPPLTQGVRLRGKYGADIDLVGRSLSGRFTLAQQSYNGSHSLELDIPGIALVRASETSARTADGTRTQDPILAVALSFEDAGIYASGQYSLLMVRMPESLQQCRFSAAWLKE